MLDMIWLIGFIVDNFVILLSLVFLLLGVKSFTSFLRYKGFSRGLRKTKRGYAEFSPWTMTEGMLYPFISKKLEKSKKTLMSSLRSYTISFLFSVLKDFIMTLLRPFIQNVLDINQLPEVQIIDSSLLSFTSFFALVLIVIALIVGVPVILDIRQQIESQKNLNKKVGKRRSRKVK